MQYTSTIWLEGVAANSRFNPHAPHWTMAGPDPSGSFTRIDSSPQTGQVNTVGSFFFTTLITLLLRLPKFNFSEFGRDISSDYFNVLLDENRPKTGPEKEPPTSRTATCRVKQLESVKRLSDSDEGDWNSLSEYGTVSVWECLWRSNLTNTRKHRNPSVGP